MRLYRRQVKKPRNEICPMPNNKVVTTDIFMSDE